MKYKKLGDEFMPLPYVRCQFVSDNDYQQQAFQQDLQHYVYDNAYNSAYTYDDDIYARQPMQPVLSNNPAIPSVVLFKELTAYPNYGNPSRNADILYTGNQGTWTFDSPAFFVVPGNQRARIIIRAVLDDHANVPTDRYSARITINGRVVFAGRLQLPHGRPAGGIFTNWVELPFNVPNFRRNNRVTIENTSRAGNDDWIGFDWMELQLLRR